jgi:hypothetical protein
MGTAASLQLKRHLHRLAEKQASAQNEKNTILLHVLRRLVLPTQHIGRESRGTWSSLARDGKLQVSGESSSWSLIR